MNVIGFSIALSRAETSVLRRVARMNLMTNNDCHKNDERPSTSRLTKGTRKRMATLGDDFLRFRFSRPKVTVFTDFLKLIQLW